MLLSPICTPSGELVVTMVDYISASEALKLVRPFKGGKKYVSAFISNADTAFNVINPGNSDILYMFVLTRISGEPRVEIGVNQGKSTSDWIQNIQRLSSKFRALTLKDSEDKERISLLALAATLRNMFRAGNIFGQDTIVHNRNGNTVD